MASLLDYVGTNSRVGGKNNIWRSFIFFYQIGEGTFSALSPNRVSFSGVLSTPFITENFNLQVELLSDSRCNVRFGNRNYTNVAYSINGSTFEARLPENATLYMSRYNGVETSVNITVAAFNEYSTETYHIQPV